MEQVDLGFEDSVLLEAEIDCLMRRLAETDPNAVLRLEKLLHKLKIECVVQHNAQRQLA